MFLELLKRFIKRKDKKKLVIQIYVDDIIFGFTNEDLHAIHSVYSAVFGDSEGTVAERLNKIRKEVKNNKYAMDAIDFIENRSKRGIGTAKNDSH